MWKCVIFLGIIICTGQHYKSIFLECNKRLTLLTQLIYLFLIAPLSFLDVELFPGSLPILGQFVDVGGQGLVGGGRLIQLFPQHGIHMGQTGTPVIKKYIIKLTYLNLSFLFVFFYYYGYGYEYTSIWKLCAWKLYISFH